MEELDMDDIKLLIMLTKSYIRKQERGKLSSEVKGENPFKHIRQWTQHGKSLQQKLERLLSQRMTK